MSVYHSHSLYSIDKPFNWNFFEVMTHAFIKSLRLLQSDFREFRQVGLFHYQNNDQFCFPILIDQLFYSVLERVRKTLSVYCNTDNSI